MYVLGALIISKHDSQEMNVMLNLTVGPIFIPTSTIVQHYMIIHVRRKHKDILFNNLYFIKSALTFFNGTAPKLCSVKVIFLE